MARDTVRLPVNLPGKVTLTSLELEAGLSYEQWEEIMQTFAVMDRSVQWWLGDGLNYGEFTYGETYSQIADSTDYEVVTLRDYKYVASRVHLSFRNDKLSWKHHKVVAPLSPPEQKRWLDRAVQGEPETGKWSAERLRDEIAGKEHVEHNSGEVEWYTPAPYIEAARQVLGEIDLDPASCDHAQLTVKAANYFTKENNALAHCWEGRVFMNPPYSDGVVGKFTSKLVQHYEEGDIEAAIVLVNNATETQWFQQMERVAAAMVHHAGRIKFHTSEGEQDSPLQGQTFLYFGEETDTFEGVFAKYGRVWR